MAKKKGSLTTAIPVEERKWRAQADARTLCEADAIKKDPQRVKAAMKEAKKLVPDMDQQAKARQVEAKSMRKLAGKEVKKA